MPPHDVEEETRFGFLPVEFLGSLVCIPGSLRLIEYYCVFMRDYDLRAGQIGLEEVIDVLDTGANNPAFLAKRTRNIRRSFATFRVARQSFPKNYHKGRVPRQINDIPSILRAGRDSIMHDLQPCERLARSWHTGQKDNHLVPVAFCFANDFDDPVRRYRQIARLCPSNRPHIMLSEDARCCLNDRWHWPIRCCIPVLEYQLLLARRGNQALKDGAQLTFPS
jgi:hypothetical protein